MNTFPFLLSALCVYAIAYRYYSAFLAAKALALDDRRTTPAHTYKGRGPPPPAEAFGPPVTEGDRIKMGCC